MHLLHLMVANLIATTNLFSPITLSVHIRLNVTKQIMCEHG